MKKKQLVGIINCSPDSYFDKGRWSDPSQAIEYGLRLFEEGADILDIGGESTRPGSHFVEEQEEIRRVIPVIEGIRAKNDQAISIDTYKPAVASAALSAGANWINDITAFSDPAMRILARSSGATVCVMHMYGKPHSLPHPVYPSGVVAEVLSFFKQRTQLLLDEGITPSQIVLDPGIGGGAFGKNEEECLQLIKHLKVFVGLGFPILIGISRKSFLQKILKKQPSEVLSTTLALNTIALLEGATYLRVHDVTEHREILTILDRLAKANDILTLFDSFY
jgi:dihydropteroate synthase